MTLALLLIAQSIPVQGGGGLSKSASNEELFTAAEKGDYQKMSDLLAQGAEIHWEKSDVIIKVIASGNTKCLKLLLENKAKIDYTNWTLLHRAAWAGFPEIMQLLVDRKLPLDTYAYIDVTDRHHGMTPLLVAIESGKTECAKVLIKAGADVNKTQSQGPCSSPLGYALSTGNMACAQLLMANNAKINWADYPGIINAINSGSAACVKLFIELGAKTDHQNWTLLHEAARAGFPDIMQLLIDQKLPVNEHFHDDKSPYNGMTPLIVAAYFGNTECARILIKAGADVNKGQDRNPFWRPLATALSQRKVACAQLLIENNAQIQQPGFSNLQIAVRAGSTECVQLLLDKEVNINHQYVDGNRKDDTALHLAVANNDIHCVRLLLDAGADATITDKENKTALQKAQERRYDDLVIIMQNLIDEKRWLTKALVDGINAKNLKDAQAAIKAGANVNQPDLNGEFPIHKAAHKGNAKILWELLAAKASINQTNKDGQTALHIAAKNGHAACVDLLLQKGADPKIKDRFKRTPLFYVAQNGDSESTELLLEAGADCNPPIKDSLLNMFNETPLQVAIEKKNVACAKKLLDRKALVAPNSLLVHKAAEQGSNELVIMLIEHGAIIDEIDAQGLTALHKAAEKGHAAIVRTLLKAGYQTSAHDLNGWFPIYFAVKNGHTECAKSLLDNKHPVWTGWTPLHEAVLNGQVDCAELFATLDQKKTYLSQRWTNANACSHQEPCMLKNGFCKRIGKFS